MEPKIIFETPLTATEIMNLTENKIIEEFYYLDDITKSKDHHKKLYKATSVREFNRYTDILTYDDSRVKFAEVEDTDYINACFVDVSLIN